MYVVLGFFVKNESVLLGVSVFICLIILYIVIFSENIRFELDDSGTMRYFKKGRLQKTYLLEEYRFGYYSKSDGSKTDITLNILHVESGTEETIDCSPIGAGKFSNMYMKIKAHTKETIEVLKA